MGSGLILTLLVLLGPALVPGTERRLQTPAPHFLAQVKIECRFANGTAGEVRFLYRDFYDRQETVRFDSRRGEFEAVAELCKDWAPYWNSQKELLNDLRARADVACRHNYRILKDFISRTVEPLVKISHTKAGRLAQHSLLICTATKYYPAEIKIKWLKNGQEQTEGLGYSEKFQNGDWTFQDQVMLETEPKRGDVYACQVEHSSRKEPITVQWDTPRAPAAGLIS